MKTSTQSAWSWGQTAMNDTKHTHTHMCNKATEDDELC